MIASLRAALVLVAAASGSTLLCPRGGECAPPVASNLARIATPATDTATVQLHISGMTCGSCPITARIALRKLPGVFSATVTLDDSLGVVRYDPSKVTPAQIAAHLTRLTGYGAKVIADGAKALRQGGK